MSKHNIGFALFLFLLLIAPELPLNGVGSSSNKLSISLGSIGLTIWFMLSSPRFGLKGLYSSGSIFLLILYGCHSLFSSLISLNIVSIARGLQYLYYTLLCCCLIPTYLRLRADQGRMSEIYNIFAWIGLIYVVGLIISFWTGPIYPHQAGSVTRYYADMEIPRAFGFSAGVNSAGGFAAITAAFFLFIYGHRVRFGHLVTLLCLLGTVLTLSRSALLSFVIAVASLGFIVVLRILLMKFRYPPVTQFVLLLVWAIPVAVIILSLNIHQMAARGLYYGLGFYRSSIDADSVDRVARWQEGLDTWVEESIVHQVIGSGFLNSATVHEGVYNTAHNLYIQVLNDFGIVGLMLLLPPLIITIVRSAFAVFVKCDGVNVFCFVSLVIFTMHNLTEVFLYHPSGVAMLVFLMSLAHTYARQRERDELEVRLEAGEVPQRPLIPRAPRPREREEAVLDGVDAPHRERLGHRQPPLVARAEHPRQEPGFPR